MAILTMEQVTFRHPGAAEPALRDVSLTVEDRSFIVVCGPIGSGKSTLLRHMKPELTPHGTRQGTIRFKGSDLTRLSPVESAAAIGFVMQDPDGQIVTDTVWHELAFGLENLAMDPQIIRRRVAEMASFFGIAPWFRQSCSTLSSGQKQILALASVLVMQPEILVLDEPTAQLDPIAAGEFLHLLERIHRELGITVVLAEQRLEDTLPLADQVIVMDGGSIVCAVAPNRIPNGLAAAADAFPDALDRLKSGLPAAMRVALAAHDPGTPYPDTWPLTPRDGRGWMAAHRPVRPPGESNDRHRVSTAVDFDVRLEARDVWFRYRREMPDVLRGLSLAINGGEVHAILGGNGSGKSTLLSLLCGMDQPQRGRIHRHEKNKKQKETGVVLLGADPRALFVEETVRQAIGPIPAVAHRLDILPLLDRHPMDLSTGERQKVALTMALAKNPRVLLLDEPTRGLDPATRDTLHHILRERVDTGCAVLLVTHDVEFAAIAADRCSLLFDGEIVSSGPPWAFFPDNRFYTTAVNRMARDWDSRLITVEDVLEQGRWTT